MSEQWAKEHCECGAINWVYLGDPDDVTGFDPDGFRCWKCGQIKLWTSKEDLAIMYDDPADANIEDGQRQAG